MNWDHTILQMRRPKYICKQICLWSYLASGWTTNLNLPMPIALQLLDTPIICQQHLFIVYRLLGFISFDCLLIKLVVWLFLLDLLESFYIRDTNPILCWLYVLQVSSLLFILFLVSFLKVSFNVVIVFSPFLYYLCFLYLPQEILPIQRWFVSEYGVHWEI